MLSQKEIECINACNDCVVACSQWATTFLTKSNIPSMNRCITQDMECANICELLSASIAYGDLAMLKICALCAEVCEKCATECANHSVSHFHKCIASCIACAKKCRELIAVSTKLHT